MFVYQVRLDACQFELLYIRLDLMLVSLNFVYQVRLDACQFEFLYIRLDLMLVSLNFCTSG